MSMMICLFMGFFTCLCVHLALAVHSADRLPGWLGEVKGRALDKPLSFGTFQIDWSGQVEQLSWAPRAYLLRNFLSDEECDHIISISRSRMTQSSVVDSKTGESIPSDVRTSTGCFFPIAYDDVVTRIEKRVAQISMVPVEHQEGLQVLHYVDGQKYEPHHDYFHDRVNADPKVGGQRVATVLMYLSTPEEGGETVLPEADHVVSGEGWSDCALEGMAVKAKKGNALLFFSLRPDGTPDPTSLHGSCPTTKGDKWSATKWIHVGAFREANDDDDYDNNDDYDDTSKDSTANLNSHKSEA